MTRFPVFAPLRLAAFVAALSLPLAARADEVAALARALAAADARDWPGAAAAAEGAVSADIVEWLWLRAGEGALAEYEAFLARRPDWPGLALLRQRGEEAVAQSTTPARVIDWFGKQKPATAQGSVAFITALTAAGRADEARAEARRAWVGLNFTAGDEGDFLQVAAPLLRAADHAARTERLLWDRRVNDAKRMLVRLADGPKALAVARIALQEDAAGVTALINAVPAAQAGDGGLAHDRFQWRMDKGMYDGAAELILSRTPDTLGRADKWAPRRGNLARELAENGDARVAYRVAAGHGLTAGGDFADLEFLAGFIALRQLNEPQTALTHFRHLAEGVRTPVSVSRAQFWQGEALAALGDTAGARAAWTAAAAHSTAYYGLLGAERLGAPLDAALLGTARPGDWRQAPWAQSSVLTAGRLFLLAGDRLRAKQFLLHLAEGLDADGLDRLADMALTMGEPHVAVLIAKQAAERGIILHRPYFPVPDVVPDGLPVSRALALAIARRESEFDPAARSPVGALGLMQVMPATAEMMAKATGQPFVRARLTGDPAYNVSLGSAYLRQLLDEFGPSVALIAAGYNAGPNRPRRWITEIGDPRDPAVDPVDWVERVPIGETRTYIMRVVESLVIYRARLRGSVGPVNVTGELTGR